MNPPNGPKGDCKLFENRKNEEFLTKIELAQLLKVSLSTVDLWLSQGMPHLKLGRSVRVKLSESIEWFQRRSHT
jgi:excisionase family DNA binding protein